MTPPTKENNNSSVNWWKVFTLTLSVLLIFMGGIINHNYAEHRELKMTDQEYSRTLATKSEVDEKFQLVLYEIRELRKEIKEINKNKR